MKIVERNVSNFFNLKLMGVILFCAVNVFICLENLTGKVSCFEFTLSVLTNVNYSSFFSFPIFIYLLYESMFDLPEAIVIRFGRYRNYFFVQLISILLITILYVLLQLAMVATVAWSCLPHENLFLFQSVNIEVRGAFLENLLTYSAVAKTPVEALIKSVLYMIFGMFSVSTLLYTLVHFANKSMQLIVQAVAFLGMIFAVHGQQIGAPRLVNYLWVNNYFLLSMAKTYAMKNSVWVMVITLGLSGLLLCNYRIWNRRKEVFE